ncbi:recombination-associated protein RdgC [Proteus sp. fly-1067]|uniref:recombination-associated protein RdgC n=1 Tax=Proteus sp. fly-1067 TaxID=3136674 RepID=UPI0032D9CFE8
MSRPSLKNAIVYRAQLPSAEAMSDHLSKIPFTEVLESHFCSYGYIPNPVTNELVTPITGGYLLTFRFDQKILPNAVIKKEVDDRISKLIDSDAEFSALDIKHTVTEEFLRKAFVKTITTLVLYHSSKECLLVASSNKNIANSAISTLIKACGSVKTETIHINDVSKGLTTRLLNTLNNEEEADCFGNDFYLGQFYLLERKIDNKKEIVKYDADFNSIRDVLFDSLNNHFKINLIQLYTNDIQFKLTSDFHFKGIKPVNKIEFDDKDKVYRYRHECSLIMFYITLTIDILIDLLKYKEK